MERRNLGDRSLPAKKMVLNGMWFASTSLRIEIKDVIWKISFVL